MRISLLLICFVKFWWKNLFLNLFLRCLKRFDSGVVPSHSFELIQFFSKKFYIIVGEMSKFHIFSHYGTGLIRKTYKLSFGSESFHTNKCTLLYNSLNALKVLKLSVVYFKLHIFFFSHPAKGEIFFMFFLVCKQNVFLRFLWLYRIF